MKIIEFFITKEIVVGGAVHSITKRRARQSVQYAHLIVKGKRILCSPQ
jgi:hypothetical protein